MPFSKFIHEFLNELLVNDELSAQYDDNADGAMVEYGLDDDQRALLLNGTNAEIREVLQEEMKTHIAYVIRMG